MIKQPEGLGLNVRKALIGGARIVAFATVLGIVGIVSSKFLGDDNPIEEAAETLIEGATGQKVDLSQEMP